MKYSRSPLEKTGPGLGAANHSYELTIVRLTIVRPNDCKLLRFLTSESLTIVAPYDLGTLTIVSPNDCKDQGSLRFGALRFGDLNDCLTTDH